jgi:AcrR family transcriptional regulator
MNRKKPAPVARRQPSQPRSRRRVEQILDATRALLHEGGVGAVTTTRIAERAGLPVGSIYQYFPNKTAIFTGMYAEYLRHIQGVMADWERDGPYAAGWREFFERLLARLKRAEASGNLEIELLVACQSYPELERLDEQHAELMAAGMARMLRRFGSRWSMAKLQRLALYVYRLNTASLVHRQAHQASARESLQWAIAAMLAVIGSCLPET